MGKKAKSKGASKKAGGAKSDELNIPVAFGNLSVGDQNARLGIVVDRARMTLSDAECYLCGARCEVKLWVDAMAKEDAPDQHVMEFSEAQHKIEAVVDIKRFSVGPKNIGAGLTFVVGNMNVNELASFAKKAGRLIAVRTGEAGGDEAAGGGGEEDAIEEDKAAS